MKQKYTIFLFIISLCLISCIKDVDFEQANDIVLETTYMSSLVYFTVEQNNFIGPLNSEIPLISDQTEVKIFNNESSNEYLTQAVFEFKTSNTFTRDFTINLQLQDTLSSVLYTFQPIQILANSSDVLHTEVIDNSNISVLSSTGLLAYSIALQSGAALDSNTPMLVNFQSAIRLSYLVDQE